MHRVTSRFRNVSYGLDCWSTGILAVCATRTRKGIHYTVALDPRTDPADETALDRLTAIQAGMLDGSAVSVAGLPAGLGFARWLATPFPSRDKARRVLSSLLDIQLPFPLEQCVYAFPAFGRTAEGNVRTLAVAARTEDVRARLEALQEHGLDPELMDHAGLACWALAEAEHPAATGTQRAIMLVEADQCMLVLGRDGAFQSVHAFRSGMSEVFDATDDTPLPGLDPWIGRVQHVLRLRRADTDEAIDWLWVGPGAERTGRLTVLQERLMGHGAISFSCTDDPATYLARALAFRGLDPNADRWTLRRAEIEHPVRRARRQRTKTRAAVVGIAAGIALCVLNAAWHGLLEARNARLQRMVADAAVDVTGMSAAAIPRGQEVFLARQVMARSSTSTDPFTRALQTGVIRIVDLCVRQADRLNLELTSIAATDPTFTVRGTTGEWARCQEFAGALREQGYIVDLRREDSTAGQATPFVLTGRPPDA